VGVDWSEAHPTLRFIAGDLGARFVAPEQISALDSRSSKASGVHRSDAGVAQRLRFQ
jgi:hypothetical protein